MIIFYAVNRIKTYLSKNYSEFLRQIKTYRENIPNVDYTILIVYNGKPISTDDNGVHHEYYIDIFKKLFNQGIILLDYYEMQHTFGYIDQIFYIKDEKQKQLELNGMPLFLGRWEAEIILSTHHPFGADYFEIPATVYTNDPKHKVQIQISELINLKNI